MSTRETIRSAGRSLLLLVLLTLRCLSGCPFYRLFRIPCPGCGLTRAWLNFLSGEVGQAFRCHPLFPLAPVFVAVFALRDIQAWKFPRLADLFLLLFVLACLFFRLSAL